MDEEYNLPDISTKSHELEQQSKKHLRKTGRPSFTPMIISIKFILFLKIIFSFLITKTLSQLDYRKYLIEVDESKINKANKKYDYVFLFIYNTNCELFHKLEPELGGIAFASRLEKLKVRYFRMNYLKNKEYARKLDIQSLPQIYFFDNKRKLKFPMRLDIEIGYYTRLSRKLMGKFNFTTMETPEQLNQINYWKKNMIFLFNKSKAEALDIYNKEINNILRLSVIAGYNNFYYSDKEIFFDHFIKKKNPQLKFDEKSFYILTGPIKNNTIQSLFNSNTQNKKSRFSKSYNYIHLNIEDLKNYQSSEDKDEFLINLLYFNKFNLYSFLGDAEISDVIEYGRPTLIIFGPKDFLNTQKNFHQEMYHLSKKYENKIKFYFSTFGSEYSKYITGIFNFNFDEVPIFMLIEKPYKGKNYFNKFKQSNADLTRQAVEIFLDKYISKELESYFVSQKRFDMNETYFKELPDKLKGLATNEEMNKKFYNNGKNIYMIEGRNFENFLKENLDKTVVFIACSSPMINCDAGLEKYRFITQSFSKFQDKIIFAQTDPNFNEYVIRKISESNNSRIENLDDFHIFTFDPLYPQVWIFPAIFKDENSSLNLNSNSLAIQKVQKGIDFNEAFDTLKLLRFVANNAQIPIDEIEIDQDYIKHDFDGTIQFTSDYDADYYKQELENKDDDEAYLEELRELLGEEADGIMEMLASQDPEKSKEMQKDILKKVQEIKKEAHEEMKGKSHQKDDL